MEITFEQYMGLTSPHLVTLESCGVKSDSTMLCLPEAGLALAKLQQDAMRQGFELYPCSSYRSFEHQARLFSNKFNGLRPILDINEEPLAPIADPISRIKAILTFSALPGFSRHHFGSDFDVYAKNKLPEGQSLQLTYHEYMEGSYFYDFGQYLRENLARFGFFNPYAGKKSDGNKVEVGLEPWHISHGASAEPFLEAFDPIQAFVYVSESDLPFAPYLKKFLTLKQINAILGL